MRNGHKRALMTSGAVVTALGLLASAGAAQAQQATTATTTTTTTTTTTADSTPRAYAYGDGIGPSWGNIRSFMDGTPASTQDVSAFWGNIRSFSDTDVNSVLAPQWGNIRSFAGTIGTTWSDIDTYWAGLGASSDPASYATLAQKLQGMSAQSKAAWGAAYTQQTGKDFTAGFAQAMFAKYGIDLTNPQTLQALSASTREQFFLDWWDNLMNYSGADHVDHWMSEVNWNPSLTRTLGGGKSTVIGLLDFSVTAEAANNVVKYGGSSVANGHGAAVASLIVDPEDGKGVMGIAPSASVIAYNPFDATQTAGWADIKTGVQMLASNNATVINMSLGVPGWTLNGGWNDIFSDKTIAKAITSSIFVIAAGNDGSTQTANLKWDNHATNMIVVGSVDPTGTISSFSNRPGTACLLDSGSGQCKGDYLMNHFMVAPGEVMLVSDGQGGVTRVSGTSFAAPLVSGTIALIQDRWPWLVNYPSDTVNIILNSAKDLGAVGVDPVYGHGELDVQAALSPLSWSTLKIYQATNGVAMPTSLSAIKLTASFQRPVWEANGVYFTLIENTGSSYRDFEVPMSSKLANKTVSVGGVQEQFMSYLQSRFQTWIGLPSSFTNASPTAPMQATDLAGTAMRLTGFGDTQATVTMRPRVNRLGFQNSAMPFESVASFASPDGGYGFQFGNGQSAVAVAGQAGFAMSSDYDVAEGGANPFLGLASGGAFTRMEARLAPGLVVSAGMAQNELRRSLDGLSLDARQVLGGARPYRANAANMTLSYQAGDRLTTTLGYTMLHEGSTILGMGSVDPADINDGSTTDGATLGVGYAVTPTLSLAASATAGRTRAGTLGRSSLVVGDGGLLSSAFQVALAKDRVFGRHDRLRLTLAQPMHVERGTVNVALVQVVDRDTGALGVVDQSASIAGVNRRYAAEMIYGVTALNGTAELNLFGRANIDAVASDALPAFVGGTSVRWSF